MGDALHTGQNPWYRAKCGKTAVYHDVSREDEESVPVFFVRFFPGTYVCFIQRASFCGHHPASQIAVILYSPAVILYSIAMSRIAMACWHLRPFRAAYLQMGRNCSRWQQQQGGICVLRSFLVLSRFFSGDTRFPEGRVAEPPLKESARKCDNFPVRWFRGRKALTCQIAI